MDLSSVMRKCLEDLDVSTARRLWSQVSPHLPQPTSDDDTLVALHMARTQAESVHENKRCYSHRWLLDRGHQSQLPDRLKPSADRLYPKIVQGVGIANANMNKEDGLRPVREAQQDAMEYAVEDCFANGDTEPALVTERMFEARAKVRKQLMGHMKLFKFNITEH